MNTGRLADLEPGIVWSIFEEITKVPRPSKKEQKIREWLKSWAKENNIECREDEVGNILLKKPASKGCEKYPTLIIQAHMDMVCQSDDSNFDFENNPIPVTHDDKYVFAEGTSLGADNGIGLAYGLAALTDPELKHGPLEVVVTVDEETGMTGAFNMQKGFFTGKYLLNVDSETQGTITISSAGGGGTKYLIPVKFEKVNDYIGLKLKISGLQGGHSGVDIHLPRANAIKVAVTVLKALNQDIEENNLTSFRLASIKGGNAHNAIPRECEVTIAVPSTEEKGVIKALKRWKKKNIEEIREYEADFHFDMFEIKEINEVMDLTSTANILNILDDIQHGVFSYSKFIDGLVQTSSNLATVETRKKEVEIHVSTRSSVMSELEKVRNELKFIGESNKAKVEQSEAYPGWEPNLDSAFLKIVQEAYEKVTMKKVELKAIHAGLECGLFLNLNPELEVTSIGPNIHNPHSPQERVEIESVATLWEVVKAIIGNMGKLR
ncbi:MAG: aminoacyl-histidine dipeptidase [Candidatus Heimdallarchaeaceae archaeon]